MVGDLNYIDIDINIVTFVKEILSRPQTSRGDLISIIA